MFHALNAIRRIPQAGALALAIGLLAPAAHASVSYQFSAGFPGGNPGNGVWTYVERDVSTLTETILSNLSMAPYSAGNCYIAPCWTPMWNDPTQSNSVPAFSSNNTNVNWNSYGSCCGTVVLPRRSLLLHPGSQKDAVVRFTVPPKPGGGSFTVAHLKGVITDQDYNGGNGVNWSVELNYTTVASGSLYSTNPASLSSAVLPPGAMPVTTGSIINIVVDANANDENFDTTSLYGAITLN